MTNRAVGESKPPGRITHWQGPLHGNMEAGHFLGSSLLHMGLGTFRMIRNEFYAWWFVFICLRWGVVGVEWLIDLLFTCEGSGLRVRLGRFGFLILGLHAGDAEDRRLHHRGHMRAKVRLKDTLRLSEMPLCYN